jgi:phosphopantothenoylcysteine decarboxylase
MTTPAAQALEFSEPDAAAAPPAAAKEPFDSSLHLHDDKFHVLLAASGSVATIKIQNIIHRLTTSYPSLFSIRLILTRSASQFLQGQSHEQPSLSSIAQIPGVDGIYLDEDEWSVPWTRGAKILHIELRRWADMMVVAPLSANTLAKMVGGLCDNLLLSTMRAWDTTGILDVPHTITFSAGEDGERKSVTYPSESRKKRILVAPAMNTAMWVHPLTQQHMRVLEEDWGVRNGGWIEVLRPIEKELACGDVGGGAMCSWETIVKRIEELLLT